MSDVYKTRWDFLAKFNKPPETGPWVETAMPLPDVPDDVLHLMIERLRAEHQFGLAKRVDVFLSRNGLRLINLHEERRLTGESEALIFAEINYGDFFATPVFKVTVPDGTNAQQFLLKTRHIEPHLRRALGFKSTTAYQSFVKATFEGQSTTFWEGLMALLAVAARGVSFLLGELLDAISESQKVPEGIWNEAARPKGLQKAIEDAGAAIDDFVTLMTSWVGKLRRDFTLVKDLEAFLEATPDFILALFKEQIAAFLAFVKQLEAAYGAAVDYLEKIVNAFAAARPKGKDFLTFRIAFLSGALDGLKDLILSVAGTFVLLADLVAAEYARQSDPATANQVVIEAVDQVIQTMIAFDWLGFLKWWYIDLPKETLEWFIEHADELADDTSHVGYYLGYFAFCVAEFAFPPLTFSRVSSVLRRSDGVIDFFRRLATP